MCLFESFFLFFSIFFLSFFGELSVPVVHIAGIYIYIYIYSKKCKFVMHQVCLEFERPVKSPLSAYDFHQSSVPLSVAEDSPTVTTTCTLSHFARLPTKSDRKIRVSDSPNSPTIFLWRHLKIGGGGGGVQEWYYDMESLGPCVWILSGQYLLNLSMRAGVA